ncbi:MAG TPA: hypothetical protein VJ464_01330, partial [Blastocatellia bacterium]|nr:hypothetical protein [Blastocatellia bacterium]
MDVSRSPRAVTELDAVEALAVGSIQPAFGGRDRDVKSASHRAKRLATAKRRDHVAAAFFNSAFLAISSDLQNPFSYRILFWMCLHLPVSDVLALVRLRY